MARRTKMPKDRDTTINTKEVIRLCNRCGNKVVEETEKGIDYPYYCPNCDENQYSFETHLEDEPNPQPNRQRYL
jgi:Zn finger protein HypA/HybF involved in hydrogenase expression